MGSEINQIKKDKYHVISLLCVDSKNKAKQKLTYRYREQSDNCQRGWRWEMGKIGEEDEEMQTSTYKIT